MASSVFGSLFFHIAMENKYSGLINELVQGGVLVKLKNSIYLLNREKLLYCVSHKECFNDLQKLAHISKNVYYHDELGNPVMVFLFSELLKRRVVPVNKMKTSQGNIRFFNLFVKNNPMNVINTLYSVKLLFSEGKMDYVSVLNCPDYGFITVPKNEHIKLPAGVHTLNLKECLSLIFESSKIGSYKVKGDIYTFPVTSVNKINDRTGIVSFSWRNYKNSVKSTLTIDSFIINGGKVYWLPEYYERFHKGRVLDIRFALKYRSKLVGFIPLILTGKYLVLLGDGEFLVFRIQDGCNVEVFTRWESVHIKLTDEKHHSVIISFDKLFYGNNELI